MYLLILSYVMACIGCETVFKLYAGGIAETG